MKKIILATFLFLISFTNVQALDLTTSALEARDINSGRVFYQKNENDVRLIASTTKIMTAILAIESNKLEDIVEAKEEILTMYGSNIYLEYHENMLLLDLVYGLVLRSGNDAATVIANYVGNGEANFVKMMNNKAKKLGMNNTTYENPHGLNDDTKNYSTAHDLATVYSYAYKNEIFRNVVGTKYYSTETDKKTYTWKNKNSLLFNYDKTTGGKTGYTPEAKRVLVTSASNNDLDIVVASFNDSIYDYDLHRKIYEDIFYNYSNTLLIDKNNFKPKNNPFDGKLYIKESIYYPLSKEEKTRITKKIEYNNKKNIKNNDIVGKMYFYLDDKLISDTDIYIKIPKTSIGKKISEFFSKLLAKSE